MTALGNRKKGKRIKASRFHIQLFFISRMRHERRPTGLHASIKRPRNEGGQKTDTAKEITPDKRKGGKQIFHITFLQLVSDSTCTKNIQQVEFGLQFPWHLSN